MKQPHNNQEASVSKLREAAKSTAIVVGALAMSVAGLGLATHGLEDQTDGPCIDTENGDMVAVVNVANCLDILGIELIESTE